MNIWIEFPPNRLQAIKSAYLADNVKDGEKIQDEPMVDASGKRMLIGTSRATTENTDNLKIGNAPWLIVHTEFPSDWEY